MSTKSISVQLVVRYAVSLDQGAKLGSYVFPANTRYPHRVYHVICAGLLECARSSRMYRPELVRHGRGSIVGYRYRGDRLPWDMRHQATKVYLHCGALGLGLNMLCSNATA